MPFIPYDYINIIFHVVMFISLIYNVIHENTVLLSLFLYCDVIFWYKTTSKSQLYTLNTMYILPNWQNGCLNS